MTWYAERDPRRRHRELAEKAVEFAASELRLDDVPAVRWFSDETAAETKEAEEIKAGRRANPYTGGREAWWERFEKPKCVGCVRREKGSRGVWLHTDLELAELPYVALHEAAHLAGYDEEAAHAYGMAASERFLRIGVRGFLQPAWTLTRPAPSLHLPLAWRLS